jgi:alpha-L-fucosidase 2
MCRTSTASFLGATSTSDRATGWATAWRINLWARLGDGSHAHDVLKLLLSSERTYPNMFDAHPPFQIDGNFGGASGMVQMLVQCDDGEIRLLPALPTAWPAGRVTGLRVRSLVGGPLRLRRGETLRTFTRTARGAVLVFSGEGLRPSSR